MEFSRIQNILGHLVQKRSVPSGSFDPNPPRDWKILVALFVVAIIASLAFHMYVFFIDSSDRYIPEDGPIFGRTIDRDGLERAIAFFMEKERLFEELQANRPSVVDPSL